MSVAVADATLPSLAGVGTLRTFSDPAVGSDFSIDVPSGEAWRIWGGSCKFAASTTVANRNPSFTVYNGSSPVYVGGLSYAIAASQTWTICFYRLGLYLGAEYYSTWFPVPLRPIWLPAGFTISYQIGSIQTDDQMSEVSMLVESIGV